MKKYDVVDLTIDGYLNPVPAVYDNGQHKRDVSSITSISIHHDAMERPHDYDSVLRYKQEAAGHYNRLGPGLQYHYKIDNTGTIFKIRPHGTWLYAVGSAENTSMIAICLDGNFENEQPTREQGEALFQLLEELCENHPEFPATWPDVRPHADYSATACCGANLRSKIYSIQNKSDARRLLVDSGWTYDWPEYQESVSVPPMPPAAHIEDAKHDEEIEKVTIPEPTTTTTPLDSTVTPVETTPEAPEAVIIKDTTDYSTGIKAFLKGKKTYIIAALIAIVNYLIAQGVIDLDANTIELVNGLLAGAGLATLRAAVGHINNKL